MFQTKNRNVAYYLCIAIKSKMRLALCWCLCASGLFVSSFSWLSFMRLTLSMVVLYLLLIKNVLRWMTKKKKPNELLYKLPFNRSNLVYWYLTHTHWVQQIIVKFVVEMIMNFYWHQKTDEINKPLAFERAFVSVLCF